MLRLIAQIENGWHLYSLDQDPAGGPIATEISLGDNSTFELSSVKGPKAVELFDPNLGRRVGFYVEKAEFAMTLQVPPAAAPGAHTVAVQVRYQSCNDKMCLPPKTANVEASVQVHPSK